MKRPAGGKVTAKVGRQNARSCTLENPDAQLILSRDINIRGPALNPMSLNK